MFYMKLLVASLAFSSLFLLAVSTDDFDESCILIPGCLCFGEDQTCITKDAEQTDLIAWYTFDEIYAFDHVGNLGEWDPTPNAGPSWGGHGNSAYYSDSGYSKLEHDDLLQQTEITYAFWLFLVDVDQTGWKVIMHKGDDVNDNSPTIFLYPDDNRLHVRFATEDNFASSADSNGELHVGSWTHVAVVFSSTSISIYLNGQLDSSSTTDSSIIFSTGPIYMGGDPWQNGIEGYVDDFRIYSTMLTSNFHLTTPTLSYFLSFRNCFEFPFNFDFRAVFLKIR